MTAVATRPRVGFLGAGWIGRSRMEAVVSSGLVEVAAIADPAVPGALPGLEELLDVPLDGLVVATPSALHAEQAIAALQRGVPVFCQKPLGRDAAETHAVVEAARQADRLLGVDLSYRHVEGARRIRELVRAGELGAVFAADLTFHNAYGPDKPWFYDRALSGGGCVIDLGIHLVDLVLWTLGAADARVVSSTLLARGRTPGRDEVEDYAVAQLDVGGRAVRLACSWNLHAGRDAVIEAAFHGTRGGAALRNVGGSFYDFRADRFEGTASHVLAEPPDDWGGGAIREWARRLARSPRYDDEVEEQLDVARLLDAIYGRSA